MSCKNQNQCCNYQNKCCNCCLNCCKCNPKCDHHKKNLADIIESIALEEAGIAHILNAEGEKLQKITANSKDICEILEANDSVSKTISNISMLEQILLSKLEVVYNIIKKCGCKVLDENDCCNIENNEC
ncbi:MAG: hypothetical protein RSB67_00510 [Clostridia bacterium]